MLITGVFCNFPKQNTPDFYIFSKIFVWRLLVWGTPLYDKKVLQSCGIYRKITHSAQLRAYWFIRFLDFPQILYGVFATSNQIIVFPKRVFTNYTIHWFRVEYIISSQIDTFISFTRKIVSSLFDVFSWYIEFYKYFYCTLLQEGRSKGRLLFL